MNIIRILVALFVAICVFVLARWAIPAAFGLLHFSFPEDVVTVLALLVALGGFISGYVYIRLPAPPAP